jgi:hypothetical protein
VFIDEKKKVGPNRYTTDEAFKQKVHGVYLGNNKELRGGLVGEIEYLSQQTPCSNYYTKNPEVLSSYVRVTAANLKRDMTVRSPEPKKEARMAPSPNSYPEKDINWVNLSH